MKKFRVTIERQETWSRETTITARNKQAARVLVEHALDAEGWVGVFPDNPDGVFEDCETSVRHIEEAR